MVTHHHNVPGVAGDDADSQLNVRPASSNSNPFMCGP